MHNFRGSLFADNTLITTAHSESLRAQINTCQQPQGPLPALIFFLFPLSTFLCFFPNLSIPCIAAHQLPLLSSAAVGDQLGDTWGTSGEDNQEQVRQWRSWVEAVLYQPALGSTGGADTCQVRGAEWWHWLWDSSVHRVGKALCCTGRWCTGIVLYMGLLAETTLGCSFVWRSCGENTLRSYRPGVCEVLVNVTPRHHPKPRKNVPYPWP